MHENSYYFDKIYGLESLSLDSYICIFEKIRRYRINNAINFIILYMT